MDELELLRTELARERKARKQAEGLLEAKSAELYERNLELEAQARALAHSNAELEQFAYVASHDLQAPLRSIASFSQLLTRDSKALLSDSSLEYLDYINQGAKRLQRLINDLLDYSRVGRTAYTLTPLCTQTLVTEVCRQIDSSIRNAQGSVVFSGLPQVNGDRTQLSRLFQNLIDNGLKFKKPGELPRVDVSAADAGAHWQFTVRDNGIGIAPEYQAKVFGMFARLHTQDEYPGTGVGLPICKKIAERHGGKLWVESAEGSGTAFHFTLSKSV